MIKKSSMIVDDKLWIVLSDCATCEYKSETFDTCDAFPWGILKSILQGKISHKEPISGDNGIQWKKRR